MPASLNHTIIWCRDKTASSNYLTEILGLDGPRPWGPFMVVELEGGLSLDYHEQADRSADIASQHYAFLVSEDEFDRAFGRIDGHQDYWADPGLARVGEINRHDGGRGVYFKDPDGHLLELITRPYGSGA